MAHHLVFARSADRPVNAEGLMGPWIWAPDWGNWFTPVAGSHQIHQAAQMASARAVESERDVTIGVWSPDAIRSRSVQDWEPIWQEHLPVTLVVPERPGKRDRWCIINGGSVDTVSLANAQTTLDAIVSDAYPPWSHRCSWSCKTILVRCRTSAEELGHIPPLAPSPDDIINQCSDAELVKAAMRRQEPREIVHALLTVQRERGLPAAPIYSSMVDQLLGPLAGAYPSPSGEAPHVFVERYRHIVRTYGRHAREVLDHCCAHTSIQSPQLEAFKAYVGQQKQEAAA